jgi:hypothetical protein
MFAKNVNEITKDDLQALIDNSVTEKKTLEYKQSLPGNLDADRKEFLADISSFSNASGGDLIYGITEDRDKGIPKKLEGLTIGNADQVVTRLENMIRDGIKPRISGIAFQSIKVLESKVALLIRIPRSWNSPHRVTYKGHGKFYVRNNVGKYPMDVDELKNAFNLTNKRTEKIKNFRKCRISKIFSNETPLPFNDVAKVVLHLIPLISLNSNKRYDLKKISFSPSKLPPLNHSGFTHKYDFEGFLTYSNDEMDKTYSYVKLYNNGILEVVEGKYLNPKQNDGKLLIRGSAYENALIKSLPTYLSALKELGIELPIFVLLSLVGIRGYLMFVGEKIFDVQGNTGINRDNLLFPEVIVENYAAAPEKVFKTCFDALWNAFGFPESPNYDNIGKRKK